MESKQIWKKNSGFGVRVGDDGILQLLSNINHNSYNGVDWEHGIGIFKSFNKTILLEEQHIPDKSKYEHRYCGPTSSNEKNELINSFKNKIVHAYERRDNTDLVYLKGVYLLTRIEYAHDISKNGEKLNDTPDIMILFLTEIKTY